MFWYPDIWISEQMNTKLFAYRLTSNTILSVAIACHRLTHSHSYSTHDLLHKFHYMSVLQADKL